VSFNKLLADASPAKAAQRLWSWRTVTEPGVPKETQQIAQQLIDIGVDELP
jgi:hypothetical protein